MTDESPIAILRGLLDTAVPFDLSDDESAQRRPARAVRQTQASGGNNADLRRLGDAVQYLINNGHLAIAAYENWLKLAFALKAFGEPGWEMFLVFSASDSSFGGEDECRRLWNGIKDDVPEGKGITGATFFKAAFEAGWQDPSRGTDEGASGGGESPRGKADAAVVAIEQAEDAGDEFWVDKAERAFATFSFTQREGGMRRVSARINSELYRGVLSERFLEASVKKVLTREQATLAVGILEHRARTRGEVREAAIRVAKHGDAIFVDLGHADGKVARIDAVGYRIVDEAPVAFVRGRGGELPLPEEGGTLAEFREHFNLSPNDLLQAVGFAIMAFKPGGPFPILVVEGPPGTAKTSFLDKTVALNDPCADPLDAHTSPLRSERDLQIEAADAHLIAQDNMGQITDEQADWWCRLATGGATSVRKNYTDEDKVRHRAIRPAMMTCIGVPSSKSDFLSRCMRVTMLPIANPLPDEMVRDAFMADRPRMLGFLFRAVSAAIRNGPVLADAVRAGELRLPRMAACAMFVEGAAELLELERGAFAAILRDGQDTMQSESALGDPLGMAILRYFSDDGSQARAMGRVFGGDSKRNVLPGTATEVLDALRGYDPDSREFPRNNKLKERLRLIGPGLSDLGIEWKFQAQSGHANKSCYTLTRTDKFVPIGDATRT